MTENKGHISRQTTITTETHNENANKIYSFVELRHETGTSVSTLGPEIFEFRTRSK